MPYFGKKARKSVLSVRRRGRRFHAQRDVLRRVEHVHQLEVLVNHADFVFKRVLRRADHRLFAVDERLPFVGKINPGDHIHKSGFSAAVLA